MTEKNVLTADARELEAEVPEDEWVSDYQGFYYDARTHKFYYLSEEEAALLMGLQLPE